MNVYFWILIVFSLLELGIMMAKWGEKKKGKYGWTSFISGIIGLLLIYLAVNG